MLLYFLLLIIKAPVHPQESVVLEIYGSEVEISSDTNGHIEIASEDEDAVRIGKEGKTVKIIIGEKPKVVNLYNFSGSYDNTKVVIDHKLKIKLPQHIKISGKIQNSKCYFIKFACDAHFLTLKGADISFDSCFTNLEISEALSSNISVNKNEGRILLTELIATPIIITNSKGSLSLTKAVIKSVDLVNFHGDISINQLQGDINLQDCAGILYINLLIGNLSIEKEKYKTNLGGVVKNINIKM